MIYIAKENCWYKPPFTYLTVLCKPLQLGHIGHLILLDIIVNVYELNFWYLFDRFTPSVMTKPRLPTGFLSAVCSSRKWPPACYNIKDMQ